MDIFSICKFLGERAGKAFSANIISIGAEVLSWGMKDLHDYSFFEDETESPGSQASLFEERKTT